MKKLVLFLATVFVASGANAEEMTYTEKMQKLQMMQHSRPNAENYLNSLRREETEPVRVSPSGRGHFYIPVSINGREINMMADTGASAIFLSQADARSIGINMGTLNYNVSYDTANGKLMAAHTTAKSLQVGNIVMEDVPVTVSQNPTNDMSLLGMEFFRRLSKYEVDNGTLILYK